MGRPHALICAHAGAQRALLRAWSRDVSAHVKRMAPHQLLTHGSEGFFGHSTPGKPHGCGDPGALMDGIDAAAVHIIPAGMCPWPSCMHGCSLSTHCIPLSPSGAGLLCFTTRLCQMSCMHAEARAALDGVVGMLAANPYAAAVDHGCDFLDDHAGAHRSAAHAGWLVDTGSSRSG